MSARHLAVGQLAAILAGGALHRAGQAEAGRAVWAVSAAIVLLPLAWSVVRTLARRRLGVDLIALLAIAAALSLGEYLAGAIVALMLSGGSALEEVAARRARRELSALIARAPAFAQRRRGDPIERVPVEEVLPGDVVVVRAGEVVPVDGTVEGDEAVVDESALTGEPLPVLHATGSPVRSGTANAGSAFDLRATRPASESAYAALVRLVRQAESQQAPFVRMADRYAAVFLPVTVVSRRRCLGGERRSGARARGARRRDPLPADPRRPGRAGLGALARGAARDHRQGLGGHRATGPRAHGAARQDRHPHDRRARHRRASRPSARSPPTSCCAWSPRWSRCRPTWWAGAIVEAAQGARPRAVGAGGRGRGRRDGRRGACRRPARDGRERALAPSARLLRRRGRRGASRRPTAAGCWWASTGSLAGILSLADSVRPGAAEAIAGLRAAGVANVAILSGDAADAVEEVGRRLGVDAAYGDLDPRGQGGHRARDAGRRRPPVRW